VAATSERYFLRYNSGSNGREILRPFDLSESRSATVYWRLIKKEVSSVFVEASLPLNTFLSPGHFTKHLKGGGF